MGETTAIEWTDATWNPVTGCTKVSPGCDHCYAESVAERWRGGKAFPNGFDVQLREHRLNEPLKWREPKRVFVNSMSDLFHEAISDDYIARVFAVMAATPQHTYQVLTKRHGRLRALLSDPLWWNFVTAFTAARTGTPIEYESPLPNVWLGVSVEDQKWADIRIPALLETPAAVRFLSCEPLLGPVSIARYIHGCMTYGCTTDHGPQVDWVIVGGESGHGFRPMDPEWVRVLRNECWSTSTAFFFKQWGGRTPKAGGRELDGRTWSDFPATPEAVDAC